MTTEQSTRDRITQHLANWSQGMDAGQSALVVGEYISDSLDAYAEAVRAAERVRLIGNVDIERASDRREYLLRHAIPCVIADSFRGDFAEMVGKEVEARWRELFAKRGLTEDTAR